MSAIGEPSEPVVFEAFRAPAYSDRSQYSPQVGSSYTQAHDDPQEMSSADTNSVQFDVVFVSKDKVIVTLGFVRCVNPDASVDSPVTDWEPTINGVPLSADDPPEIGVAAGQVLYCEVKTNNKGIVLETPRILVGAENETGTHYQPPQKSPQNGSLKYPIAKFESSGDELVATQLQQGGPILVQPNLWEGRNVGGFREIYKERQNAGDYYEFRTLEQLEGDGHPVLKALEPGEQEGDTLKIRRIAERKDYPPQIKVEDGGNVIRIRGNSKDLNYFDPFGGQVNVIDGLVTSVTPSTLVGKNLNLTVVKFEWAAAGPEGSMKRLYEYTDRVHYWRGGVYIGTTNPADAPADLIEQTITQMVESS